MGTRSQSAAPPAWATAVEPAAAPGALRTGRRGVGWPWLIVGVGLALGKADALTALLDHRPEVIAFLGLGLALSVLRPRPIGIAATAAPLLAFTLAPASTALGIALGVGGFVLLLALFIAIGTVLHARQDHDRAGA